MAIEILNNCHFDATRIVKLYLATQVSTGGTINFPVNYHTLSGTSDSIIKYESWDATNIVQIGDQLIQFNEVLWVDENISFNEELIIDQRGRNYVKTLTFELNGIDQTLVDQLEALGLDHEGMLCPPKTLAILIDENENELIAGYDFPFRLESITTGINGDQNSITLTYISNSHSRARNAGFPTPSPSPTPSITPSISLSRTPSITPSISISPSISLSITPSITPTINPTITPTISITSSITPSISFSNTPSITPSISFSRTPSITPSISFSRTPSITPSISFSNSPSITPSISLSRTPSITPTITPSITATINPTITPTISITSSVTPTISLTPSITPSISMTPSITPSGIFSECYTSYSGFNNYAECVKLVNNNDICVGGIYTSYSGVSRSRITRLLNNGYVNTTFVPPTINASVSTVETLSDGNIICAGFFTSPRNHIIKLDATGTEVTFARGTAFNNDVYCSYLQSDGKTLWGGEFTAYSGVSMNYISRLNTDGTIDTTFTSNIGTGFNNYPRVIHTQSDGKIIIGGLFTQFDGNTAGHIVRLNADGSYDSTFNSGAGFNANILYLDIQSDDKIICMGSYSSYSGISTSGAIRLNADGTIDNTFNAPAVGSECRIQNDGKIVMFATNLVRLNTDGSYDTAFNTNVGTGPASDPIIREICVQPDGKIILVGQFTSFNGTTANGIIRLNSDGTIDSCPLPSSSPSVTPTISLTRTPSISITPSISLSRTPSITPSPSYIPLMCFSDFDGAVYEITSYPNNELLIGGNFNTYSGNSSYGLVKILNDGYFDNTFISIFSGNQLTHALRSINFQSDGKIIIGGTVFYDSETTSKEIYRLNSDGTYDSTFNTGTGFTFYLKNMIIESDDKILAYGAFTSYSGIPTNRIARLNSDGTYDSTFNVGTGFNSVVFDIKKQSDEKLIVVGLFTSYSGIPINRIVRLNSDFTYDSTFNVGTGFNNTVRKIKIQADNKILIVGSFTSYSGVTANRIIRLNDDGSIDTTFNTGSGFNSASYDINLQSSGKIIIGGTFNTYSGQPVTNLIRLNTDGLLDSTFNNTGILTGTTLGSTYVSKIHINNDDSIIIGGLFSNYDGNAVGNITKLDLDGNYYNDCIRPSVTPSTTPSISITPSPTPSS